MSYRVPMFFLRNVIELMNSDASDPKLIKIEGTMEMCGELGIDPEAVSL